MSILTSDHQISFSHPSLVHRASLPRKAPSRVSWPVPAGPTTTLSPSRRAILGARQSHGKVARGLSKQRSHRARTETTRPVATSRLATTVRPPGRGCFSTKRALLGSVVAIFVLGFLGGCLALVLEARPAEADVLVLKNGNQLEGRVRQLATGKYEVFVEPGQVFEVSLSEVVDREVREAPYDELVRRLEKLARDDHRGHERLARWAEERRLRASARTVFQRLLEIDPHHAAARDRLGYVLYKNRWVLRTELEGQGLVRFRGLWMGPEEVETIRTREAVEEFRRLLADVHHENRYLRENALTTVVQEKNPRLLGFTKKLLDAVDPVERLVAGRVLGNFSYDEGAEAVQSALLSEPRDEVRAAYLAALRQYEDRRLGTWIIDQLRRWHELDATARRNLLILCEVCPFRDALPTLIRLRSEPDWGDRVDRVLARITGASFDSSQEWNAWWEATGRRGASDLGSGWLP